MRTDALACADVSALSCKFSTNVQASQLWEYAVAVA